MLNRIVTVLCVYLLVNLSPAWGATLAKKTVSPNGMTVLLLETHSLPMVQIELLVRAGSILDSEQKAGVAYLTANLLEEGTTDRTSVQIADELDSIGTTFDVSAGSDYATFSLKVLKKDLDHGLNLFSNILLHPKFPEEEVVRKKTELIGHLIDEKDEPEVVASRAFNKAVFGQHPYHLPIEGDEESIKNIFREDIVQFYQSAYGPKGAILALVGDLTETEAKDIVKKYFGNWTPKPVKTLKNPSPPKVDKRAFLLIDKDLTQSSVILGNIGISRTNPDYYPLLVMNYILGGGGFSSRMVIDIRDNQGLVYSLFSHFDARLEKGDFSVMFQTKNSSANKAIFEVLDEIKKIQSSPVTPTELQEAKDYLIGSFPLKMDTNSKLANLLIYQEFYGLGLDYYDRYVQSIKKVTTQDVQRAARQYLDPEHYVLVVVGKQSEAKIDLKGLNAN